MRPQFSMDSCNLIDIAAESFVMHPTLLAESLNAAIRTHTDFSRTTADRSAASTADRMADAIAETVIMIEDGCNEQQFRDFLAGNFSAMIQAAHCAARLLCIPRHVHCAAAIRQGHK